MLKEFAFDEVVKLAEQLTPEEQQSLIEHLQGLAAQRHLTMDEWGALFESLVIDVGVWPENLSLRREDWYDDDVF